MTLKQAEEIIIAADRKHGKKHAHVYKEWRISGCLPVHQLAQIMKLDWHTIDKYLTAANHAIHEWGMKQKDTWVEPIVNSREKQHRAECERLTIITREENGQSETEVDYALFVIVMQERDIILDDEAA